jgi:hypothetical protein
MRLGIAVVVLLIASPAFAQSTFWDNFQRGLQMGQQQRAGQSEAARQAAEAEYYRQQALLIKQQREQLEREAQALAAQKASTAATEAQIAEWTKMLLLMFERKHPDYKQYERDMVKFGSMLTPSNQMNPMDFLEALYLLAKSDIPR